MEEPKKRIETKQEAKKGSCDYGGEHPCGAKPVVARDFKGNRYCRPHSMMMGLRGIALEIL